MRLGVRVGVWLGAALLLTGAVRLPEAVLWRLAGHSLRAHGGLAGAEVLTAERYGDLDGGGREGVLWLRAGRAGLRSAAGRALWTSPPNWQVRQAALAPVDGRPGLEAVLLVWRPYRPWPVDAFLPNAGRTAGFHNAEGLSCHVILIGCGARGCREVWAGSPLADPLQALALADLDGDGQAELAALEGRYAEAAGQPAWRLSVWGWEGFGFQLRAAQEGRFGGLGAVRAVDGALGLAVWPENEAGRRIP